MSQHRIEITKKDYVFDRFFEVGQEFDYSGTETVTTGCSCNGSREQYNTYVVFIDGKKYNIRDTNAGIKQNTECSV
jgi:hypothetical protein